MVNLEEKCVEIISNINEARKLYNEALSHARDYEFEDAKNKLNQGDEYYEKAHKIHAELIGQDAKGDMGNITMLLLHAEDQLVSSETLKVVSKELILNYEKIQQLEIKMKWS